MKLSVMQALGMATKAYHAVLEELYTPRPQTKSGLYPLRSFLCYNVI